jgi:glutamyl-tRNA(Gln) amidotransferase subunit E
MSKLVFLNSLEKIDPIKYKLKCGLEIHQQLNCGKLFSRRPCNIIPNVDLTKEIRRKLRFSLSENGETDKAAAAEAVKQKTQIYRYNNSIASLVDLDEEPPGVPNPVALSVGVRISQMFDLKFFDKIQFMRKIIVDGSVTSGFQRTAMLGFGGVIKTSLGDVSIDGVNVEEDSCRAIERGDDYNIFALDRQGIPLIELTTGPQIKTPLHAQECALQLGTVLRSFSETRRGLGTIRQDLNVSILNGSRIEIKGAQNLKLIPEIIEAEMRRQAIALSIIEEFKNRKLSTENFSDFKVYDVTKNFDKTESSVILSNLEQKKSGVYGIKLYNFKGVLGHELHGGFRFATEISDKNKTLFPKIKGLFHSDELPKYGITEDEVDNVRKTLGCGENDGFILLAQEKNYANSSFNFIFDIIKELMVSIPEEVRQVDPKGTVTKFLRPMPGAARMYPETDVSEIEFTQSYLDDLRKEIPELYSLKLERLSKQWNCSKNEVEEFLSKFGENDISVLLSKSHKGAQGLYQVLFELPKDIKKRDKLENNNIALSLYCDILDSSKKHDFNQKVLRDVLVSLYKDNLEIVSNFETYLKEKELLAEPVDESAVENKIKEIIEQNKGAPFGALMGKAMGAFNGKVDGKLISALLKKLM